MSNSIYTPSEIPFQPTYLYIKQHSVTGKLYFGKTINNPETYYGSGVRWLNHIKRHGRHHVVNLWYCLFYDAKECKEFALMVSTQQNIVESKEWLNLIPEIGVDSPGHLISDETKSKIRAVRKGKPRSAESVAKQRAYYANKVWTDEDRAKLGGGKRGKNFPLSEEHKAKLSAAKLGKKQPRTKEHNAAISAAKRGKKQSNAVCKYCGLTASLGCINLHHNERCKKKGE